MAWLHSLAFIFSLSALFVKLTAGRVPVLQITLIRSGLSFLVSTGIIKSRGIQPMFGQRQHVGWLIARGVTGALAMISFYAAILMLPLADAMTLFFLNPCMTAVAAWAIRGEPLGLLGVAGCAWSILGLVLITHPPMLFGGHADWGPKRVLGTLLGVTSAVFATGAFICIRFVGKAEPAIVVALYFHTSTMLLSAAPLLLRWPSPAAWLSWLDALLLVGVAATSFAGQLFLTRGFQLLPAGKAAGFNFSQLFLTPGFQLLPAGKAAGFNFSQLFLTRGFQLLPAGKAAGFNFSQVVYSYAFGIFFFHEHLSLFGVAGTALIALGMACVTARTAPQQQQQRQGDQIKLSDEARDAAGAGLGSRMFSRILQLDSLQQQQQQDGSLRSSSSSSSFLTRMQSFQRLLADRRRGEGSADSGGYQYHAAGSSEAEGVGLLPQVQERSSEHASGLAGAAAGHAAAAAAAAAGSGSGSQSMASRLLAVEEQAPPGMGPSIAMQMDEDIYHTSGQQAGEPDDVINNCGAPAGTAAADSSADDSDDDAGSSGSDTAAQLLLQLAADHSHKRQYELGSNDAGPSSHRDPTVAKRMKARRESARVRRARRKESTNHLTQENDELRQAIKKLQHSLASLNPALPATAFYYRNPNAMSGGNAAAAAHSAAAAASAASSRKRAHGEKMTQEELKQARREAAHRSREREKLYRQALEDDNTMLQQEHSWLQQQGQLYGKAQLEQRLKRLSDAAAALLLGS
ncbi:hypothetical protein OEZ85_012734 [Tetradesmus obliquus]|uniref:EamA domain-containing protein n=1 Tax=Tetradesmus obliquus TaxID=3088 RepID=A0ABY8U3H9_TETOB|nr:hypothetical protein OEZ85_012734 [Tetradesmus obliquus]